MPVIFPIGSGVSAMDKRLFRNEATFQVTMYLARVMLAEKLITEKEYQTFEQEMLHKYQPSAEHHPCYSGLQVQGAATSPVAWKLENIFNWLCTRCTAGYIISDMPPAVKHSSLFPVSGREKSSSSSHCIHPAAHHV